MHENIILNNGLTMPAVGFGTWMLKGETGKQAIREALSVGYRLIDTAHMYDNEAIVARPWPKAAFAGRMSSLRQNCARRGLVMSWPGRASKNRWPGCRPTISTCCSSMSLTTKLWICIGP